MSFFIFFFIDHLRTCIRIYVRMYFPRRFYLYRARVIPLFFTLSLSLSYRASFVLLFSLTGTLSPFGSGRHPSSEATKSRHLLKSSSRNITTAVVPFNIDEGVTTDGSGTRCRVSNIHSHASALNFTLFVMIRILFLCPRSIFGSTLIPQISSNEMGNFEIQYRMSYYPTCSRIITFHIQFINILYPLLLTFHVLLSTVLSTFQFQYSFQYSAFV